MFTFANKKYALDLCGGYCILTGEFYNIITKQENDYRPYHTKND